MARNNKITTDGGGDLGQNPFGALSGLGLPEAAPKGDADPRGARTEGTVPGTRSSEKPTKNRGRVDILRTKAGRGGKTVTIVKGFVGIGLPEKEQLAKKMQRICGCGGTVKDGQIEIQGDKREEVARVLTEAGFRPVMAGG